MPPQPAATADIPPPPVLSQDQLRLMPDGMKLNSVSPDLTGIARTERFTAPNNVPLTPAVGTVSAGQTNPVAGLGDNTGGQDPIGQLYQDIVGRERSGAAAVSPKGAIGIGQIMPSTAAQYGVSREALFDPKVNEQVSKHIILDLWNKYRDADAVRVAYNAGPGWADRWLASGRDSSILPHETQNYLAMSSTGGANIPYANEQQAAAQAIQADLYGASDRARKQADGFMSEVKDFKKDLAGSLQRIHEARGRSDEAIVKATEAANYQPKPPLIDGFANLGSLGAIIGMMGGLLTKSPMIASLNAGAAAIEAANRGDMAQYERAYDSWKTNSDMLFKIVDLQQKRAQEIMGDEKFMTEEKRVGLDLYLRAINQEQLADEIRIRGTQFGYEHFKTMGAAAEKYDENRIRLQETHEQHRATQEAARARLELSERREDRQDALHQAETMHEQDVKDHPEWTDEQKAENYQKRQREYPKQVAPKPQLMLDYGKLDDKGQPTSFIEDLNTHKATTLDGQSYTPVSGRRMGTGAPLAPPSEEAKDTVAKAIAEYRMAPFSAYAMRSPYALDVMQRVMKFNSAYNATEYTARSASASTMGRRAATLTVASNAADQLIPIVQDLSKKVHRTQYPTVNAIMIAAKRGTGDPDVVAFGQALNSLLYVYMRALNPSGIPRVADLERGEHMLQAAWTSEQLDGVLTQMKTEIAGEKAALKLSVDELGGIFGSPSGKQTGIPDPMPYKSEGDVNLARARGDLTPEEAKQIIRSNFEKPPQGIPRNAHWVGTSNGVDVWRTPDQTNWTP